MSDQPPQSNPSESTAPKPTSNPEGPQQCTGSQVPFPSMIPADTFSPTTEKQVSDLLAEMQQYATTAVPGTTTTMQFAYQKSKHTKESSGQDPQVVESSQVQKSVHQTPPPENPPATAPKSEAAPTPQHQQPQQPASIFTQIPQFFHEKLGLGIGQPASAQQQQQQQTQVSYQSHKKTTTTTTTTAADGTQKTVTTTSESNDEPTPAATAPQAPPQGQENIFTKATEKLQEQVSQFPHLLQETLQHIPGLSGLSAPLGQQQAQTGQSGQVEVSYQHTKTTKSQSATTAGEQHPAPEPVQVTSENQADQGQPLKSAAEKLASGLEQLVSQATKILPGHSQNGVHYEVSKHESRQTLHQTGAEPPKIETTSSGYTQVVHGIFNGMPVVGSVVPVIVPVSMTKPGSEFQSETTPAVGQQPRSEERSTPTPQTTPQQQPQPQNQPQGQQSQQSPQSQPRTVTIDSAAQLEEQLKKLGIASGHPIGDLLQQTLSQQRAQTPETNIEIQYSAQRTHSSRTVTYEASGSDPKSAHDAFQKIHSSSPAASTPIVTPQPPQASPGNSSQQKECLEDAHVDEDGNIVLTKKITRVTTTTKTVYDDDQQKKDGASPQGQ